MVNCHVLSVMLINTEYFTFTLLHFYFSAFLFYVFVTHFILGRKPSCWNDRFLRHVYPKGRTTLRQDWLGALSVFLLPGVNGSFKAFNRSFSNDTDNSIRFPCPNHNCGRIFNWKRNLTRHLKYECGLQPRFKCPYCDYYGKLKGNVSKHLLRRHNNRKIYVVDLFQATQWVWHDQWALQLAARLSFVEK